MTKDLKKVEEVQSAINNQEQQALGVLIQAVKIATNKGAFELDDAVVIGNAKSVLQGLIKE
jgi:precorrin isomerase